MTKSKQRKRPAKLPRISSDECIKALQKEGFYISRIKGSHHIMRRDNPPARTVVSQAKELPRGTLRKIIRDAGMTRDEFIALVKS